MSRRDRTNRKTDLPAFDYTDHGHMRRTQRCKRSMTFRNFLCHFDRDIYVNGGVSALSITDDTLEVLVEDGHLSRHDADRLIGLVILVGDNDNRIRSVIRGHDGRLGKYLKRWS
jgi:hypothetical protein